MAAGCDGGGGVSHGPGPGRRDLVPRPSLTETKETKRNKGLDKVQCRKRPEAYARNTKGGVLTSYDCCIAGAARHARDAGPLGRTEPGTDRVHIDRKGRRVDR